MSLSWIPFEWPQTWRDPARLSLIENTPINCLLLPPDAPPEIQGAAAARKLACPAVHWQSWKEVAWQSTGDLVAIRDGVWPELALRSGRDAASTTAQAGPTGPPWLDANGWLIQMARCRAPAKAVWLKSDPPANPERLAAESYLLAAAEPLAYGARRPVWLAAAHAEALAKGQESAVQTWRQVTSALNWHAARKDWASWPAFARLVIVSDFSGPNEYNASEVLNLAARRNLAFEPVESGRFRAGVLTERRALLYVDQQPMTPAISAAAQAFVESGGLLLMLPGPAKAIRNTKPSKDSHPRFDLFNCGKGRLAISKGDWEDPYVLAQDTHLLMSRRWDTVRLFNAGSIQYFHTASPDGRRWLVHLLNYARMRAANQVVLQSWRTLRSATFHGLDDAAPQPLEIQREPGQQEVYLPRFRVYGAVELELTGNA